MNYDIVICYRMDDAESANIIKNWLENNGYKNRVSVCSVNFGGGLWNPIMHDRVENCNDCIVIISDNTFEKTWFFQFFHKDYLIEELEHAYETNKRIVPVIKDPGHFKKKRFIPKKIANIINQFNQICYHYKEPLGLEMCMRQMILGEMPFLASMPHIEDTFYKNVEQSQNTYQDSALFLVTNRQEAI